MRNRFFGLVPVILAAAVSMFTACNDIYKEEKAAVADEIKEICGKKNYRTVTNLDALRALYQRFTTTE